MMQTVCDYSRLLGFQRVRECLESAQASDLYETVGQMATARFRSQRTADVFSGAARALLDVVAALEAAGVRAIPDGTPASNYLTQTAAAREVALVLAATEAIPDAQNDLGNMLGALCAVALLGGHRVNLQAAEPPPPKPPAVVDVRVVAMPDRQAETVVHRDAASNIEKVVRVETDIEKS